MNYEKLFSYQKILYVVAIIYAGSIYFIPLAPTNHVTYKNDFTCIFYSSYFLGGRKRTKHNKRRKIINKYE